MSSSSSPAMPSTPAVGFPAPHQPFLHQLKSEFLDPNFDANRRQRIQMACQHCRHRKIRCCGGSPCNNCLRVKRECVYKAVPEEVNRATREKKLAAKATKATVGHMSTGTMSTPYFADQQVFEAPYLTTAAPLYGTPSQMMPHTPSHRRMNSHPVNLNTAVPYMEPQFLSSPAQLESSPYQFSSLQAPVGLSPQVAFPSVLEGTPDHARYLQQQNMHPTFAPLGPASPLSDVPPRAAVTDDGYFSSAVNSAWSTPGATRPEMLLPATSYSAVSTPVYETPNRSAAYRSHVSPIGTPNSHYSPYMAGPPTYHHAGYHHVPGLMPAPFISSPVVSSPMSAPTDPNNSPTLAPEMSLSKNLSLMGLGISVSNVGFGEMPHAPGPSSAPPLF